MSRSKPPYVQRTYRHAAAAEGLVCFTVKEKESDLWLAADRDCRDEARRALAAVRREIEAYIARRPEFLSAMTPLPDDPEAPEPVRRMLAAGAAAGVGPMAAVAGTTAEFVGRALLTAGAAEVLVENGGDLFIVSRRPRTAAVFAGESPWSMRLGLRLAPEKTPVGLSTSSGTVGPSISFGRADAAVATAADAALADAAATAVGNLVKTPESVQKALHFAEKIEGLSGVLLVVGDRLGVWGDLELVELSPHTAAQGG